MLAKLSIRAKLVAVVSMLLVSPAAIGGFGLLQMRSQNAYLMDIQTSWLPSVQTLGELRANWDHLRRQIFRQARIERNRAIRIAIGTVSGWVWRGFWRLLRWCRLRAAWISHVRKGRERIAAAQLRGLGDQPLADMGLTRGDIENRVRFRARLSLRTR